MTKQELGSILARKYEEGKKRGLGVCFIHLFGIEYANHIRASGYTPKEIAEESGIGVSFQTEIAKGIKLSQFVEIKK